MAHVDVYTKTDPDGTVYHFRDDRVPGSGGCMFPIGYIYMSVDSTDPGTIFGGTWERIQDRFLLAAGSDYTAGTTGGEATHTLTVNEMPSHSHTTQQYSASSTSGPAWNTYENVNKTYADGTTRSAGGGQPHNNMPPYLTVYMWKRTA